MIFSTKRLIIREFQPSDLEAIHQYAGEEHVSQFQAWGPNTVEQTQSFLGDALDFITNRPRLSYELGITLKSTGELIGGCGIFIQKKAINKAMIGYTLNPRFWGNGFATEATQGLILFGKNQLSLETIQATCDVENLASKRVLEKSGFELLETIENHTIQKGKMRSSFLFELRK